MKHQVRDLWVVFTLISVAVFSCQAPVLKGGKIIGDKLMDGTYIGEARGVDQAKVKLIVANKRIEKVEILKLNAMPPGMKAKDSIPQRIVDSQSTTVDAVTGATGASNTIMNAAENAVQKSYTDKEKQ